MRGHKFIILVGDSDSAFSGFDFALRLELTHQITWNEDEYLEVITCPHEKFSDNVVIMVNPDDPTHEVCVVRDMDGKLWYYTDYMSKGDVINKFEQTDS